MSLNLSALSQMATGEAVPDEHESHLLAGRVPCPVNWNPDGSWQHRPVIRATDDSPRRPLTPKPDNIHGDDVAKKLKFSRAYWESSFTSTWDDLHELVRDGFSIRRRMTPCDVAFFPAASGMVVIDCDVKRYDSESGFIFHGNTATLAPPVIKYGFRDLQREVEGMGHQMTELATYTVKTKSGGYHLYYREHPEIHTRNSGHRHDWRVDVVAHNDGSDRSWVAAPPTDGYEVVRDLPVATLPTWLAEWLTSLDSHLQPVGRQRRQAVMRKAADARSRVATSGGVSPGDHELLATWVNWELSLVALANQEGGWNLAIYQCVLNLLDGGWELDAVSEAVLKAAQPSDDMERRRAADTVASAHRRHRRKMNGGGHT